MNFALATLEKAQSTLSSVGLPTVRIAVPAMGGRRYKQRSRQTLRQSHDEKLNLYREDLDMFVKRRAAANAVTTRTRAA